MKTVYPNALRPIAPFEKPVEAITTPITNEDNVLLCIDRAWLPVIRGCLLVLVEPVHWKGTEANVNYAIEQIHELLRMTEMGSCECVLACIQGNSTIWDEIIRNSEGNPDEVISDELLGKDWLDGITCTNDKLWGSCQYIVDGVMDATFEVLQRVKFATSPFEAFGLLTDSIPILNFVGDMGEIINWLADVAYDAFFTADSEAVRNSLACDLFCLASVDCTLNMNMLYTVISANAKGLPPLGGGLEGILEWYTSVIFSSDPAKTVVATIGMLGVEVMRHGGKFGEWLFSVYGLEQLAKLGASENENNSWTTLCTSCYITYVVNYEAGEYTDYVATSHYTSAEIYEDGEGNHSLRDIMPSALANTTTWVQTKIDLGAEWTLERVKTSYFGNNISATNIAPTTIIRVYDGTDTLIEEYGRKETGGGGYTEGDWDTYDRIRQTANVRYVEIWVGATTGATPEILEVRSDNHYIQFR